MSRQQPNSIPIAANVSSSRQENTAATTRSSRKGFCGSFGDCMTKPTIAAPPPRQSSSRLELQVEELQKEVKKEKEMRCMYKMRLERTQDYLKYCLQVAQDNGFLKFILNKNDSPQQPSLGPSSAIVQASINPQPPPTVQHNTNLSAIIEQAKLNGWYIHPHEIELHKKVAQGSTAEIYKATWRGLDVAVKCIFPDFFRLNDCGVSFFAQEVETLSRQRHTYVLQLMGACLDPPNHGWVVTEFLNMTLKDWLHGPGKRRKERVTPLPPFEKRLAKALEVAQGMQYLHEHKPMIIHRDLKPSNIFLDDAFHVRVADFGHARFLTDEEKAFTGETGTFVYMAPEVIRSEPYDEKCDVYSFGIILNELLTGQYPYIETDYGPSKIALQVGEGKIRPALPEHDDKIEDLIELTQLAWDEDPEYRPSFATITRGLKMIYNRIMNAP
ncbi:serine/threonine-protein kinase STY17-like [Cynara cardunculus var. scolymus]|uniref:serine/threonine-protein kinase STY17-like n=1 Tax=Cynara cardunculus var. scolymus TaxID=59895 RepID=UPI000D62B8BB|nr:serine/threonine-protein kinase STY17-like [Cynara cardunculus var. scolymus]